MKEQFKNYLNNMMTNELIEEDEKLPFTEINDIREESIFLVVNGEYRFEYNCYMISEEGTEYFDFELVN